jgi:uncharacterized membrane protein YtjA (UPF0391 family)
LDFVIERVKAAAIGTHIAHAICGRLRIEIRFRLCIDSVPRQESAHTKIVTIVRNWNFSKLQAHSREGGHMLYLALFFLIVALIAGHLGFAGVAYAAAGIAATVFLLFLVALVVALVRHVAEERTGGA